MIRLLEDAVATVARLSDERQDGRARVLLQLAGEEQPPYALTAEEEVDLDISAWEAAEGDFAPTEEIKVSCEK